MSPNCIWRLSGRRNSPASMAPATTAVWSSRPRPTMSSAPSIRRNTANSHPSRSWKSRCPALPIRRSRQPAPACCRPMVQYAPYTLKEGWAPASRNSCKAIMAQLETYAPGIGKSVRHAELLTPADIETRYRMPGGHWHHGELQADQMLMSRPVSGCGRLRHAGRGVVPRRRRLASGRRCLRRAGFERRTPHHRDEGVI